MPIQQNVTEVVRWCMTARRENQRQLSEALGLAVPTISLKMNGRRPWTLEEIEALARHFDVDPTLFLSDPAKLVGPQLAGVRLAGSIGTGRKRRRVRRRIGGAVVVLPLPRRAVEQVAA